MASISLNPHSNSPVNKPWNRSEYRKLEMQFCWCYARLTVLVLLLTVSAILFEYWC